MQDAFFVRAVLLLVYLIFSPLSWAQTPRPCADESVGVADSISQTVLSTRADSIQRVQDSLEVQLLRSTRTYPQLERLLASLPLQSKFLDSLPAILPVALPIEQFRISSPFGLRQHPIHKQSRFHGGVDVKAPVGMIVKATAPGVISGVGYEADLGAYVRIEHAFGFETMYGHLKGYCVKAGQFITLNQEIGRVGQTGMTTGPHLHYVIKKNGSVIDPFDFCFLLRRRLWLYERSKVNGTSAMPVPEGLNLSSKGA